MLWLICGLLIGLGNGQLELVIDNPYLLLDHVIKCWFKLIFELIWCC